MIKLISIEAELKNISKNYWLLDYNNLYINLGDTYSIRVTFWFRGSSTKMV